MVWPEIWYDFSPGQRVVTREGYPGTVDHVEDGPVPGVELYYVVLDDGEGQGLYSTSELAPEHDGEGGEAHEASLAGLVGESVQAAVRASVERTAADDYPELGSILLDRPPPAASKVLSMVAASLQRQSGEVEQEEQEAGPGEQHEAGWVRDLFRTPDQATANQSYDWCRFRRESRCWLPKGLDAQRSQLAGYAVWVPEDRGQCPRSSWKQQQQCPVGQPGPNAGGFTDATTSWEHGGQHGGTPVLSILDNHDGVGHHEAMPAELDPRGPKIHAQEDRWGDVTYSVTCPDHPERPAGEPTADYFDAVAQADRHVKAAHPELAGVPLEQITG